MNYGTQGAFSFWIADANVSRGASDKLGQSITRAHADVTKGVQTITVCLSQTKPDIVHTLCLSSLQTKYETNHMIYN